MQKKKAQLLIFAASMCLPVAFSIHAAHANPPSSSALRPQPNASAAVRGDDPQDRSFVQTESDMTAKTRLFGPIGPGLRAVHRSADGRTYVLASPSPGLVVYDSKGKQLFTVAESSATPGAKPTTAGITFG